MSTLFMQSVCKMEHPTFIPCLMVQSMSQQDRQMKNSCCCEWEMIVLLQRIEVREVVPC